jgi:hypothetical protein
VSARSLGFTVALAFALGGALAPGCTSDEDAYAPHGSTASTTGGGVVDAGPDDAAPDAPPSTPKRTVKLVNPYGAPGNLFADGDLEWSIARDDDIEQFGFLGFDDSGSGSVPIHAETGGLCHSGLHCGILKPNMLLFARATAAPGLVPHRARVYAKVRGGATCDDVTMMMVTCDTFVSSKKLAVAEPDDGGWCRYEALLSARDSALCLFVQSTLKGEQTALVDDAWLVGDDGEGGGSSTKSLDTWQPSAEDVARLQRLRDTIRRRMPLGGRPAPKGPPRIPREP